MNEYKKKAPQINFNSQELTENIEDYLGMIIHLANEVIQDDETTCFSQNICTDIIKYSRKAWDLVPQESRSLYKITATRKGKIR